MLEERSKDAGDVNEARQLSFRAAEVLTVAGDGLQASAAWKRIVDKFGAARDAHAQWMPLLEALRQWPELAQALAPRRSSRPRASGRRSTRASAQVRLQRTRETDEAIDAFKRALAIDAAEKTSRAALEKLLLVGDHRLAAAAVLEPLYRAEDARPGARARARSARAAQRGHGRAPRRAAKRPSTSRHGTRRSGARAIEFAARGLAEAVELGVAARAVASRGIDKLAEAGIDPKRLAALLGKALGDRAITSSELSRSRAARRGGVRGER